MKDCLRLSELVEVVELGGQKFIHCRGDLPTCRLVHASPNSNIHSHYSNVHKLFGYVCRESGCDLKFFKIGERKKHETKAHPGRVYARSPNNGLKKLICQLAGCDHADGMPFDEEMSGSDFGSPPSSVDGHVPLSVVDATIPALKPEHFKQEHVVPDPDDHHADFPSDLPDLPVFPTFTNESGVDDADAAIPPSVYSRSLDHYSSFDLGVLLIDGN